MFAAVDAGGNDPLGRVREHGPYGVQPQDTTAVEAAVYDVRWETKGVETESDVSRQILVEEGPYARGGPTQTVIESASAGASRWILAMAAPSIGRTVAAAAAAGLVPDCSAAGRPSLSVDSAYPVVAVAEAVEAVDTEQSTPNDFVVGHTSAVVEE